MDDPHRQPREADRKRLADRVRRAAADGRITDADRDIRLGNIGSAQSLAELDLIGRDLDQLEAAVPPVATVGAVGEKAAGVPTDQSRATSRAIAVVAALLIAVGVAVAAVLGLFVLGSDSDSASDSGVGDSLLEPSPIPAEGEEPAPGNDDPADEPAAEPAYSLTGPGVRAFLRHYQEHFGTADVLDLTLYGDYVVVDVPVPGKARHEGWIYRQASGFTSFGGIAANRSGTRPVDVRRLDVAAMMRNVDRARRTLNVEDPTTTYVIVRHHATFDEAPTVDIHVGNEFRESGYLATFLDGTIERAYPYEVR